MTNQKHSQYNAFDIQKHNLLKHYGVVIYYSEENLAYILDDGIFLASLSDKFRFQDIGSVLVETCEMFLYYRMTGFVTLWYQNNYVNYRGWRTTNGS